MIVGLDMGGTHIDGVIIKDDQVINTIKKLTDTDDLFNAIWTTLAELLAGYDKNAIKRINLSTTISTNAIVEKKTSPVGMVIQSGPGLNNEFLACGGENIFVSGYVDHRGKEVDCLDFIEIERAAELFKARGIKACAAVSKFSTRNPNHELNMGKLLGADFEPVTLGHRMSGKLNFPRRVFTSYLNSAVHSTFKGFAESIKRSLAEEGINCPIYILKADGGTMDIGTAEARPVETILSGPAASFMGISAMLNTEDDAILLDIGGTTTDIFFLADGVPLFEPAGAKIAKYNTLVRAVFSVSIGLGGDSSISVQDKKLKIGPTRMGKPYAFGGPTPTPTDAMIYLGLIEEANKESQAMAAAAMELLGQELGMAPCDVAKMILETMAATIQQKTDELLREINSKPVYTVQELLHGKKIKPMSINLIGGPAAVLGPFLEDRYQLPCFIPVNYSVANAVGAALAKPTVEITMLADTAQGLLSVSELGIYEKIPRNYSLSQAEGRAKELLTQAILAMGIPEETIDTEITEASSFNMVDGFRTTGKNIRIKAQIKPGHILTLRSGNDHES